MWPREVSPEQKAEIVTSHQRAGHAVALAGHVVDDAPALALADVGIVMGSGPDEAMESAEVTLLKGDLAGVVRSLRLSAATMRTIRRNLSFALIYTAACMPITAGMLYPLSGVLLSQVIAASAPTFSTLGIILNAFRLRLLRV
jgi:Cu+-exporting ATPase